MLPGIGPAPVASGPDAIGPKRMDISNDYCQHYIDTRERPQNFIRDAAPGEQWAEVRGRRRAGLGSHSPSPPRRSTPPFSTC